MSHPFAADDFLLSAATVAPYNLGPPPPLEPFHFQEGLREYQERMLSQLVAYMRAGYRRILLQLPTGGGKTVMAASLLGSAAVLGLPSQFIVHRRELITQTSRSFLGAAIDHGFVASGRRYDPDQWVHLAGVQTLVRRLASVLPPALAIVDEAHHATAASWAEVMREYENAVIVGLTATPERLDGRGLREHFEVMIEGPSVAELIAWGFLSPFEYFAPHVPDMTGVRTTGGDYNRSGASAVMDRPRLIGDMVEHYLRLARGHQGIVFAASRDHSRKLADAFRAEGVRAMHVDGETPDKEREWFDEAFRAGEIEIGTNVGLFGEGYDVPNVSYVGIGAPTKSLVNHRQWCGRALRIFPGKTGAILADHAGNALRGLGLPDDRHTWSLDGKAARSKAKSSDDADAIRQCLECFRIYPARLAACPRCQVAAPPMPRGIEEQAGTLTKLEKEALRKREAERKLAENRACGSYEDLLSLAKARGYRRPHGWAFHQAKLRRFPIPPRNGDN